MSLTSTLKSTILKYGSFQPTSPLSDPPSKQVPETGGPNKSVLAGGFFQDMMHTLQLTLQVTHVKEDPQRPDRPRIYFAGVVAEANTTTITGHVRMTDDDEIRWSFVGLFYFCVFR